MGERLLGLIDIDNTFYDGIMVFPLAKSQQLAGLLHLKGLKRMETDLAAYRNGMIGYETFAHQCLPFGSESAYLHLFCK